MADELTEQQLQAMFAAGTEGLPCIFALLDEACPSPAEFISEVTDSADCDTAPNTVPLCAMHVKWAARAVALSAFLPTSCPDCNRSHYFVNPMLINGSSNG